MKPVHYSRLHLMAKSPAHYKAAETYPREDTLSMRIGRLVHSLVLGGDYVVYDGTRRGKAWDAFVAENEKRDIVTASEFATAEPVATAVKANDNAMRLLTGDLEIRREWSVAGRAVAGRLDCLGAGFVTDLKTTTNAEPGWFARQAIRMGYHAQLAWYLDGAAFPTEARAFIVAVETTPPNVVTCFELSPRALDMGRRTYRLWMERLLVCEASDTWPGYVESIIPLDSPEDETLLIDGEEIPL